jgi:hypothetical protein
VFRKLDGHLPEIEMGAAYRRDASSNVLRAFLDVVKEVTGKKRKK